MTIPEAKKSRLSTPRVMKSRAQQAIDGVRRAEFVLKGEFIKRIDEAVKASGFRHRGELLARICQDYPEIFEDYAREANH